MSTSKETQPKHISINVNLAALLGNLQIRFQHLSDFNLLAFVGAARVEDADFNCPPFFASQQLAANNRLPLPRAREQFATWCLKNTFTEGIDLVGSVLEECRMIAALYQLKPRCTGADWNRVSITEKKTFHRLPFPHKISQLRDRFGVSSKFERHVLTLNRTRNCLIHRLGVVADEDVDSSGHLTVTWHALQFIAVDSVTGAELLLKEPTKIENESSLSVRIGTVEKVFSKNERITFSPEEINYTMLTFYVFALELAQKLEAMQPTVASPDSA